ncbi:hypothetical protein GW916_07470 [bacterium]|nr:hypothetical protein [bacterium]
MVIIFKNPKVNEHERTSLADDVASGTTLSVQDTSGFAVNDLILIGQLGNEKTEVRKIATVASKTSLTISAAISFSHSQNAPIYKYYYDKIDIQYRTSSAGSWTVISGMPINLLIDETHTSYNHTSGASTYQYRARYYNSITAVYSDWSSVLPASGFARDTLQFMTDQVYLLFNDLEEDSATRNQIRNFFNEAQELVSSRWDKWFFLYREDSATASVDSTSTYALPTDLQRLEAILYEYTDDNSNTYKYRLLRKPEVEFDSLVADQSLDENNDLRVYTLRAGDSTNPQGYFETYPTTIDGGGTFYVRYYMKMDELTNPSDTTPVPIPRILVDYAVGNLYDLKHKEDKSAYYLGRVEKGIEDMKQLSNRTTGQKEFIKIRGRRRRMMDYYGSASIQDRDTLHENYF